MPIYEYECIRCGAVSSLVVRGSNSEDKRACQSCGSSRLRRLMSTFAVVASEASRLAGFDTSTIRRDESFYKDGRNVGLWAKKRAQEMGVNLGSKFDETVEKARSGQLVKDMM